jgi:hypothetical protein
MKSKMAAHYKMVVFFAFKNMDIKYINNIGIYLFFLYHFDFFNTFSFFFLKKNICLLEANLVLAAILNLANILNIIFGQNFLCFFGVCCSRIHAKKSEF